MVSIPFKRSRKPERKHYKTAPLCWLICAGKPGAPGKSGLHAAGKPGAGGLEKRFSGCPALVRGGFKEKVESELSLPGWKLGEIQKKRVRDSRQE